MVYLCCCVSTDPNFTVIYFSGLQLFAVIVLPFDAPDFCSVKALTLYVYEENKVMYTKTSISLFYVLHLLISNILASLHVVVYTYKRKEEIDSEMGFTNSKEVHTQCNLIMFIFQLLCNYVVFLSCIVLKPA